MFILPGHARQGRYRVGSFFSADTRDNAMAACPILNLEQKALGVERFSLTSNPMATHPKRLAALLLIALAVLGFLELQVTWLRLGRVGWTADASSWTHEDQLQFARGLAAASTAYVRPNSRGVILPLYDDIASLGLSLLLELHELGMVLPVEIPHCGDLGEDFQRQIYRNWGNANVRVYDVCSLAMVLKDSNGRQLFCSNDEHCRDAFRGFDIKILAVVLSEFEQLMLLDADTLFLMNPGELFATNKFQATGTLFFPDRVCSETKYLGERVPSVDGNGTTTRLRQFLSTFDVSPFRSLGIIGHSEGKSSSRSHEPSAFLRETHAWKLRSGHQMDSSCMLWDKPRQQRATAILASFIALHGKPRPPSYGDKELFFIACELADTQYAFSDLGVGVVGWRRPQSGDASVLCGDSLHFWPELEPREATESAKPLYVNGDHMLSWDPEDKTLLRSLARKAGTYPGSFESRGLPTTCPFDIEVVHLTSIEEAQFTRRRELHDTVVEWGGGDWSLTLRTGLSRWWTGV